jgi:competence transcription factor ComK
MHFYFIILLYYDYQHILATHVTIFRVVSFENKKTVIIKMSLKSLHSIKNRVTSG